MRYLQNYLAAMGKTPLIALPNITQAYRPLILAKAEQLNPGGSVKDRIGPALIEQGEREGALRPGGTIIEPTSGNTGVGLAIAAATKGYKLIVVMPDKVAEEKRALLRAYGAEVIICPSSVARESEESYYSVADRLACEIPNAYQPNQYFNPANADAHYHTTGPEIWEATSGRITHFVCSVGTGGTVTGAGRFLKEQNPDVVIVGADPEGSIYSEPENMHPYLVEGIGQDFWPGAFDPKLIDRWVTVSDRDSYGMARRIAREEGMLVGSSTGTAMHAALVVAADLPEDAVVVVVFCDTGRNYVSKLYNEDWLRENGVLDEATAAIAESGSRAG